MTLPIGRSDSGNVGNCDLDALNAKVSALQLPAIGPWGQNIATTIGLTYGYFGGPAITSTGGTAFVGAGTISVVNGTNYVERTYAGLVVVNQVAFSAGNIPMAVVVAALGAIISVTDWRGPTGSLPYFQAAAGEASVANLLYPRGSLYRYGASGLGVADDSGAMANAKAAAIAYGTGAPVIVNPGTFRMSSSVTLTAPVGINFLSGGLLSVDAGKTFTVAGPIIAPSSRQIFSGAGSYVLPSADVIYAKWFGAVGDDATDNTTALQSAITACQASGRLTTLVLGPGIFRHSGTLNLGGPGQGFAIVGSAFSTKTQGNVGGMTVLKWTGGAAAQFSVTSSYYRFENIAFWNFGTATNALLINGGGREVIRNCSVSQPAGGTAYSDAAFNIFSDYWQIDNCDMRIGGYAIKLTGGGTWGLVTMCLFDSDDGHAYVKIDNNPMLYMVFTNNSFNFRTNASVAFDFSTASGTFFVDAHDNEFACAGSVVAYIAYMNGVGLFSFHNNGIDGFGSAADSLIQLTATKCSVGRNGIIALSYPLVRATDTASIVYAYEHYATSSTKGIIDTGATTTSGGYLPVTIATGQAEIHPELANPQAEATYLVTATTNAALEFTLAAPGNSPPHWGYSTKGQTIVLLVKNASGGAMGAISFDTNFALAGAAVLTSPANTAWTTIKFVFDGTHWTETGRMAAGGSNTFNSVTISTAGTYAAPSFAFSAGSGLFSISATQIGVAGDLRVGDGSVSAGSHTLTVRAEPINGVLSKLRLALGTDAQYWDIYHYATDDSLHLNYGSSDWLTISSTGALTLPFYGTGGAVTVGAADSGGAGYKLLRVPN